MLAVPAGASTRRRSRRVELAALRDADAGRPPGRLGHPDGRRPLLRRCGRDPHDRIRGQRHRDDGRVHPQRPRHRHAARDRSSSPPATSRSCRSAITHQSSKRQSRSRPTAGSAPPPERCSTRSNVTPEYEEQTVTADTITAGVRRRDSFRHPMPASRRACQHPSNRRCPTLGIRGGVALSASSLAAGRSGQSRSQQGRELAAPMSPFQHS